MPELPEVETVRLALAKHIVGRTVRTVEVRRRDMVHGNATPVCLLAGTSIERIDRRGKQLAIFGNRGNCVCIHLGMTGSVRYSTDKPADMKHCHIVWRLDNAGWMIQRDPRRFGGLWPYPTEAALHQRWATLGPDALTITARELASRLANTHRTIKAALLDQTVLAGLGNIYVDELLFTLGIHPRRPAADLKAHEVPPLVRAMRSLLKRAIRAGGSTVRDYVDANGESGGYQLRHRVYGRAGKPCVTCGQAIQVDIVGGRTTAFCPNCQRGPV